METASERAALLYRQHGPVVYRRCVRLLRNPDAARDATQEVFMKLIRHMERLEDRADILPWLYRVATNYCLNRLRDAARHGERGGPADFEVMPGPIAEAFPVRQLAHRVLARFDEETAAIAVGSLVEGMDQAELAEMLGISTRTVARKLERFLEQAKKIVERS